MGAGQHNRELASLEREVQSEAYAALLQQLRGNHQIFRRFSAWPDAAAFMRGLPARGPQRDIILKPILMAHQIDGDHRWRAVLLLLFWTDLQRILKAKHHWDLDKASLWSKLYWAFTETISKFDLLRRPAEISRKILNDTIHCLYENCHREWVLARIQVSIYGAEDDDPDMEIPVIDSGIVSFEAEHDRQAEIGRLEELCRLGVIQELDLLLLIGTRFYGRSLRDCARETGLRYDTAKKRRQRAEAAVQGYEKKSLKKRKYLSPPPAKYPP